MDEIKINNSNARHYIFVEKQCKLDIFGHHVENNIKRTLEFIPHLHGQH